MILYCSLKGNIASVKLFIDVLQFRLILDKEAHQADGSFYFIELNETRSYRE
jgi:hypothetical protein